MHQKSLTELRAALDAKEISAVELAQTYLQRIEATQDLNAFISVVALTVGVAQLIFLFNLFWSLRHGKDAVGNPWNATTLEWQTPETPPGHGNWGAAQPVVYRWAYDYSVTGAAQDFIPQNEPPAASTA